MQVEVAREVARRLTERRRETGGRPAKRRWIGWGALATLLAVLVLTTPRDEVASRHDPSTDRAVVEAASLTRT